MLKRRDTTPKPDSGNGLEASGCLKGCGARAKIKCARCNGLLCYSHADDRCRGARSVGRHSVD